MTWQELADFIYNKMPECNRNQSVTIWDYADNYQTGDMFYNVRYIEPYDVRESPSEDNFYSMSINTDNLNDWWDCSQVRMFERYLYDRRMFEE